MFDSDRNEAQALPVLACLGVASRFRLVMTLAVADRCVGELADAVGLSQSCTTRHLQALERVGLVKRSREGRRVRFRLKAEAPGLTELLRWALPATRAGATGVGVGQSQAMPAVRLVPAESDHHERSIPPVRSRGKGGRGSTGSGNRSHLRVADNEDPGVGTAAGPRRWPGDLEDYLL
jgi:DNA-binding transcriptional ArsR family regulator